MTRLLLIAVCAGSVCLLTACSPRVDFERMRQQPRADPFGRTPLFSDGMTMRTPPAGTLPSTRLNTETTRTGAHAFGIFCAVCHGEDGRGDSVVASNMLLEAPPSLLSADALARSDGEILDIVTHGMKRMPAYDWALSSAERSAVVSYVRQLQRAANAGGQPQ